MKGGGEGCPPWERGIKNFSLVLRLLSLDCSHDLFFHRILKERGNRRIKANPCKMNAPPMHTSLPEHQALNVHTPMGHTVYVYNILLPQGNITVFVFFFQKKNGGERDEKLAR